MEKVKVILWGLGAMGSGMGKYLLQKEGIELVGGIERPGEKVGKDLGELLDSENLGVQVSDDPEKVLQTEADVVLIATSSFVREVYPQIEMAAKAGHNIISIAEEMAYPWAQEPEFADKIDKVARENNVTVLGTGINPGFVMDLLVIALSGACARVDKIKAARVNDLSPFGPTVMETQGVGTTPEEFEKGIKEGTIVGHVGFPESIKMIADALGWELDEIEEKREPIISNTERETPHVKVKPGMVAGCRHIAFGRKDGKVLIEMEHPQQIHPHLEGQDTGDYVWIEGEPDINVANKPEVPGGIGTMAVTVNMIPRVITAQPGLVSMKDLPVPATIMGDVRDIMKSFRN